MRYKNMNPAATVKTLKELRRWRQERARKMKFKDYSFVVPNVKPDIAFLRQNVRQPSITWIGHSTFLLQHSGLNIVTDPVWAGQMGMYRRLSPPGVPLEQMPPVDIALISHSHYDHLHIRSLKRLTGSKTLIVPAGLADKLQRKGFSSIIELNWWETAEIGGLRFTFVPSQHWTRRTLFDTNRSHWGGYVIEPDVRKHDGSACGSVAPGSRNDADSAAPGSCNNANPAASRESAVLNGRKHAAAEPVSSGVDRRRTSHDSGPARPAVGQSPTVYFAGDSGYFDGFKTIGERFDIDVALMPIGAYEPEWFMGPQHVTPEEALRAFADTGARWFVPMHYGSFRLADDTPREALDRLEAHRAKAGIASERVVILPHGETWRLGGM